MSATPEHDEYPRLFDCSPLIGDRPTRWAHWFHRARPRNGRATGNSCPRGRGAARRKEASGACWRHWSFACGRRHGSRAPQTVVRGCGVDVAPTTHACSFRPRRWHARGDFTVGPALSRRPGSMGPMDARIPCAHGDCQMDITRRCTRRALYDARGAAAATIGYSSDEATWRPPRPGGGV